MKLFDVAIVTAEKMVYQGKAVSVTVPGGLGNMGILADHMPLISTITPGVIAVQPPDHDGKIVFRVKGKGFLQIARKKVTVILDGIEH